MIKKKKSFIVVSAIGIVVLVIVTNYYWTLGIRAAYFVWTANEFQPTPKNTEISIFELIESCLQQKEALSREELNTARQCLKTAATEMKLKQSGTDADLNETKALYPLSMERETARQRVESTVREVFYFINAKLDTLSLGKFSLDESAKQLLSNTKHELQGYKRALFNDLHVLRHVDQDEEWRVNMSRQLGELVQRRLHDLQNPQDCTTAKLIVCNLERDVGFVSILHEATMCLLTAYAVQRTLVLTTNGWRFSPSTWDTFMMPLSENCTGADIKNIHPKTQTASARVVDLKSVVGDWFYSSVKFRPRAIPADLAKRLRTFHDDPPAWWVGQLVSYLLRPQPHLQQTIKTQAERIGFQRPIVGIQVRRTDKVNDEAVFHSVEEYMKHVEEYYDLRQQHEEIKERRLFLATDDSSVFAELQKKYPRYHISMVEGSVDSASVKSRYTREGLSAVLVDLHFLSMCDFVVCTYSSNICRAVHELMQTRHGDASNNVHSLDSSVYFLTGGDIHYKRAVLNHEARSNEEISLQVGDLVHIQTYVFRSKDRLLVGNLRNGFSVGINKRTGKRGHFPSYKVVDEIIEENMGLNTDML